MSTALAPIALRKLADRYFLQQNPRRGGMATVYRALDLQNDGAIVAVKLFDHERVEQVVLDEVYRRETLALREVHHPNIAAILDDGIDQDSGNYFIVLEWADSDLDRFIATTKFRNWEHFAPFCGLPLLGALSHAHARHVIHRDVKPANVLVTSDGIPKLTDFGIAKLKKSLSRNLTLNEFVSRPFCPQEIDDGSYSYTRDVFGFAVLVLHVLSDKIPRDYADLRSGLDALRAPKEVREILGRALSSNPQHRQVTAAVLLAELENISSVIARKRRPTERCFLSAPAGILNFLKTELSLDTTAEVERFISEDLNAAPAIRRQRMAGQSDPEEGSYELFGSSLRYKLRVRLPDQDQFVIVKAIPSDFDQLERSKGSCWKLPYLLQVGRTPDTVQGRQLLEAVDQSLEEFEMDARQRQAKAQEEQLFRVWSDILKAKLEFEKERETPLHYSAAWQNGNRIEFTLTTEPGDEVVGQLRRIQLADRRFLGGEVEDVRGNKLVLHISYGEPDALSQHGILVFDTTAAEQALNRQNRTLESVKLDLAIRGGLKQLLIDPSKATLPEEIGEIQYVTTPLDDAKKDAVRAALGAQDFLIVEGPPGSGKTAFIAELILQHLRRQPNDRILLTSQTHVALDNAIGRLLRTDPSLNVVRIARVDDQRVGDEGLPHLVNRQKEEWAKRVTLQCDMFMAGWANRHGIDKAALSVGLNIQKLISARREEEEARTELREAQGQMRRAGASFRAQEELMLLRDQLESAKRTRHDAEKCIAEAKLLKLDVATASAEELERTMHQLLPDTPDGHMLRKVMQLQAEWVDRFGRGPEFDVPLLERAHVVAATCLGLISIPGSEHLEYDLCILDEASKATATEALVPMARAKRWVLVGDSKQLPPFEDELVRSEELRQRFELRLEDVKETMFDRLIRLLPPQCRRILGVQYRMAAPIGHLVSRCFYAGELKSARTDLDAVVTKFLGKPVVWLTTSLLSDRREREMGTSFANPREVREIENILLDFNDEARRHKRRYRVALLSGYAAQLQGLRRAVNSRQAEMTQLDVACMTVDAVQGREFDLVVFSLTRSNQEGGLGFLRDDARINVALSRAMEGLLIVGDHKFIEASPGDSPLKRVLAHVRRHPSECEMQQVNGHG